MPGVEPGSQAWEACMMPLHYMRHDVMINLLFKFLDAHYWCRNTCWSDMVKIGIFTLLLLLVQPAYAHAYAMCQTMASSLNVALHHIPLEIPFGANKSTWHRKFSNDENLTTSGTDIVAPLSCFLRQRSQHWDTSF